MLTDVLNNLPSLDTGNKVISVLSGGLDSTIVTHTLVRKYGAANVIAISYNYGQKQSIELEKAIITCNTLRIKHKVLDISFLGEIVAPVCALSAVGDIKMPTIEDILGLPTPPTYVPFRNEIIFSIGLSFAESNNAQFVFNGLQAHDEYSYWDTSSEFVKRMNAVSELNREHMIEIISPFVNFSKKEEIEIGVELGVDWNTTWTCYEGENGNGACGRCPSCSERIMNFAQAGIKDTCPYAIDIPWDRLIEENKS